MIIVAGRIHVDAAERDLYLENCRSVIEQARRAPGCIDFHLSADLLEPERINIFEQWESVPDVEAFRGSGPDADQAAAIREAQVAQYEVASSKPL